VDTESIDKALEKAHMLINAIKSEGSLQIVVVKYDSHEAMTLCLKEGELTTPLARILTDEETSTGEPQFLVSHL
tara:strand:+ start:548 stop:769 length:222 start_codon:yes stop_codon:yes gene_type:complete